MFLFDGQSIIHLPSQILISYQYHNFVFHAPKKQRKQIFKLQKINAIILQKNANFSFCFERIKMQPIDLTEYNF